MGGRLKAGARRDCADCQVRLCFDSYRCVFGVRMRGGVERKEYREDETDKTGDIGVSDVFYVLGGHGVFLMKRKGSPRSRQNPTATVARIKLACSKTGLLKNLA